MSQRIQVITGARSTEALAITITSSTLDLLLVHSVALAVTDRRLGTTGTWPCDILSASHTELVARHAFAAGEVDADGSLLVTPHLTVHDGADPYRAEPFVLVAETPR